MRIIHIVGARPNFMKAAPVIRALGRYGDVEQVLIHTGQHYDRNMSEVFFRQLGLPDPDINLNIGSDSHARQTAAAMVRLEQTLTVYGPNLVVVYGDINSTLAAALVAAKIGLDVAHVEAGLRSFDRTMPEEINRILTDRLARLLFTPSVDGNENLVAEGVPASQIHFVGNVMIDTLVRFLPSAEANWHAISSSLQVQQGQYAVVTLHRPANVDTPDKLQSLIRGLSEVARAEKIQFVFPIHPRTRSRLESIELNTDKITLIEPLCYVDFLTLQRYAKYVITDSGGVQEEATYLHVPCYTMRNNTERPVTISHGTNTLVGTDVQDLLPAMQRSRLGGISTDRMPLLWDGVASERIAEVIVKCGNR